MRIKLIIITLIILAVAGRVAAQCAQYVDAPYTSNTPALSMPLPRLAAPTITATYWLPTQKHLVETLTTRMPTRYLVETLELRTATATQTATPTQTPTATSTPVPPPTETPTIAPTATCSDWDADDTDGDPCRDPNWPGYWMQTGVPHVNQ